MPSDARQNGNSPRALRALTTIVATGDRNNGRSKGLAMKRIDNFLLFRLFAFDRLPFVTYLFKVADFSLSFFAAKRIPYAFLLSFSLRAN